jgi:hypothetical protein
MINYNMHMFFKVINNMFTYVFIETVLCRSNLPDIPCSQVSYKPSVEIHMQLEGSLNYEKNSTKYA